MYILDNIGIQFSVFSAAELNEKLISRYDLGNTTTRLFQIGMNEVYRVQSGADFYFLRISPYGFRKYEEVEAEIQFLLHLNKHDVPIAMPVSMRDESYITRLSAPEGVRYAVLFENAGDETRGIKTQQELHDVGAILARIHLYGDGLAIYKKTLDVDYFIYAPIRAVEYYYAGTPEFQEFAELSEWLRAGFAEHWNDSYGILHADPHNYNIKFTGDKPCIFDFDSFGYGLQMYDLGEQYWNINMFQLPAEEEKQQIKWLLEGYESVRPLTEHQRESIPFLAAVRDFRLMGAFLMSTFRNRDTSFIDSEFAKNHIEYLKNTREKIQRKETAI